MAKIKIERSKRPTTEYQTPQLGGAALPTFQIGAMVEQGFDALTKPVMAELKLKKKIEDRNDLHDLTLKALPKITDEYNKYSFSTKSADAKTFLDSLNEKNFSDLTKNSNREVKNAFINFLQEQQIKLYPKLKGEIALRHIEKIILLMMKN